MTDEKLCQIIKIVTEDKLIVGDHDSLTMFGASQQNELRRCTRSIMSMMLLNNGDTDAVIEKTLMQIESAEEQLHGEKKQNRFGKLKRSSVVDTYKKILAFTDQMTLTLQLQKAQLLKNEKTYEHLEEQLRNCENQLSARIKYGQTVLDNLDYVSEEEKDIYEWRGRLGRRVEDMQVSHVVSEQSILQLDVLRVNDRKLIGKISAVLSETIPAWQMQVIIALGIEKTKNTLSVQEKLTRISARNEKKGAFEIYLEKKNTVNEINPSALMQMDTRLVAALQGILSVCKEDRILRQAIINSISS